MAYLYDKRSADADEEEEQYSVPESATPRPWQRSRLVTAGGIGSGATPSFQPRQNVTPLRTDVQYTGGATNTPLYSASSHSTYHSQPFETPGSQEYSPESWGSSQFADQCEESNVSAFSTPSSSSQYQFNTQHRSQILRPSVGRDQNQVPQHSQVELRYRQASQASHTDYEDASHTPQQAVQSNQPPRGPSSHSANVSSYSNSRTWVSENTKEHERWLETQNNLRHMELIPRSPFVPHNYQEWLVHREAVVEDNRKAVIRSASLKGQCSKEKIAPAFGGKTFADGGGAVLAQQTIFHEPFQPRKMRPPRKVAEWPDREEMKEEGDERNTSRFGRFPGLPRKPPSHHKEHWKTRPRMEPTQMDKTWPLPTRDSYEKAMIPPDPEEMMDDEEFLGPHLMRGLDCDSDSEK